MAFCLRGKISVGTNDLSPKEATEMSHEVKYIGYVELDIVQSIFSSAARLQMGVVGEKS
jgi:hypothetical protein